MSRIHVTALLAFSTLVLPVSIAHGQTRQVPGGVTTSNQGSATGNPDIPTCQGAPGGSRMERRRNPAGCGATAGETTVRTEAPLDVTLELPQPDAPECEATSLTEYSQRNNVARVTGTVSIATCPAGSTGTCCAIDVPLSPGERCRRS